MIEKKWYNYFFFQLSNSLTCFHFIILKPLSSLAQTKSYLYTYFLFRYIISPKMSVAFVAGVPASVHRERRIENLQTELVELLKAEQPRKVLERNPALRQEVELEDRRKLEEQRRYCFREMEDIEREHMHSLRNIPRQRVASHFFCAWRKQALSELQHLQETERLSRECLGQDADTFLAAKDSMIGHLTQTLPAESYKCTTSSYPNYLTTILPITTPEAFRLKHPFPPDCSNRSARPPGVRLFPCKTPQIPCGPDHCHWLKKSAGLQVYKGSDCDESTRRKRFRPWANWSNLIWGASTAANNFVKNN